MNTFFRLSQPMLISLFLLISMNMSGQTNMNIKNKKITLNVKFYQKLNSETIILLHGGPGVPDDMLEIVEILKNKYQIITFEQRGVGLSKCKKCSFTMSEYISDIEAITKELEIKRFHLFGHSWGGLYAQIYADYRPDKIKSLFLCSPSSGTNKTWKQTEKEVMQYNKKNTTKKEWLKMGWNSLLGMLGNDKAYQKLFKQVLNNYHKNYLKVDINNGFLDKIVSKPINKTRKEIIKYKNLPLFSNPNYSIQITYGDNDIYGKSKNKLIARFPTADIITIQNSGHIPWKHNSEKFTQILKDFYRL